MIFTCPRCARSYAVPDGFAGLLCPCAGLLTPILPGAGAPSPASTTLGSAVPSPPSAMDGGRGQGDVAPVSTGRGAEKASQRSSQGQGAPIEPMQVTEADKASGISLKQREAANDWITNKFYKKDGVGDEWRKIVAACKAFGMQRGEKWRDWVKSRWDSEGPARDAVIRMLVKAGLVPSEEPKAEPDATKKAVLDALAKLADMSLDDLKAHAGPKVDQTVIDALLDAGLIYEGVPGKYRLMQTPKGG